MKLDKRASGVLLHVTCLPSKSGIGDLGPYSYEFIKILPCINQCYWSILPLTPTNIEHANSPYKTDSAFAGNTLLVSPELLIKDKLLPEKTVESRLALSSGRVDYRAVSAFKHAMIEKAYSKFNRSSNENISAFRFDFETFCSENSKWLDDYALYKTLRKKMNKPWHLWPHPLRDREIRALNSKKTSLREHIRREKFAQFAFFRQWQSLKEYCERKNVKIIGDMAFYVNHDSADVWTHPDLFELDGKKRPKYVGGVPPDYFSRNGQLWGSPVYRWKEMQKTHFEWWTDRIRHGLKLFDNLRLDHFRGFVAYWRVPAEYKTARSGKWVRAPSKNFFRTLTNNFPHLPFLAEDLGVITDNVKRTLKRLNFPGMRVLLFAFDGSRNNPHLPYNHTTKSVAFTGTHDTNTVRGWFMEEATFEEKRRVFRFIGKEVSERAVSHEFIKLALTSRAALRIIPIQDALSLGSRARMNNPARQTNNWEWRLAPEQLTSRMLNRFGEITKAFGNISSDKS